MCQKPWHLIVTSAIFFWLIIAQLTALTKHLLAWVQLFVLRHVESGVPVILAFQHGQPKLGRKLTLLMATCIYVGNSVKDLVCAARPPSPICRVVSSEPETEFGRVWAAHFSYYQHNLLYRVIRVHRTFSLYYSRPPSAASLTRTHNDLRTVLGMATIFAAKEGSKFLATIVLLLICFAFEFLPGFRFHSSSRVKDMM